MGFEKISEFEKALGLFTGAPYAIMTDCCTHALELCFRYDKVKSCVFTPYTYLSIPMTMHKLGIQYGYYSNNLPHRQIWLGEYKFEGTRIWDSARLLQSGMYRPGQMQCLSFGYDKPLSIGHGGAILLDDAVAYKKLLAQRYDGRDLTISPWQEQKSFEIGYHYRPTIEDAVKGLELLPTIDQTVKYKQYPDLRLVSIN